MKAWLQMRRGDLDSLTLRDIPPPVPESGQVRIRLAAAALNPVDLLMLRGRIADAPAAPWIPGIEFSGRVDAISSDGRWRVGDRVCGTCRYGALAELLIADDADVLMLPNQTEFTAAACLPIAFPVAHLALRDAGALVPGQTVVVVGAAGAVGLATIQLARLWGASVVAVARGTDRLRICRQHGASLAVDATGKDWVQQLGKALGGKTIDLVVDTVGIPVDQALCSLMSWRGRVVATGFAGGSLPTIAADAMMLSSLQYATVFWGETQQREPALAMQIHADLYSHASKGELRSLVGRSYPLSDAPTAFKALDKRSFPGKILLVP